MSQAERFVELCWGTPEVCDLLLQHAESPDSVSEEEIEDCDLSEEELRGATEIASKAEKKNKLPLEIYNVVSEAYVDLLVAWKWPDGSCLVLEPGFMDPAANAVEAGPSVDDVDLTRWMERDE